MDELDDNLTQGYLNVKTLDLIYIAIKICSSYTMSIYIINISDTMI